MRVRCAICGYEAEVYDYRDWTVHDGSWPDLFICDDHRRGFSAVA